jgi:hypothetical protein
MLFIFDENYPKEFVEGFSILERANKRKEIAVDIVFGPDFMGKYSATDEEMIQKASLKEAVIVTHDSDFKRIKHYKPLLIEHKVGYIYFKVPKGRFVYWDIVKAFVNRWEELKEKIINSEHPFAFEINKLGQIAQLPF